MDYICKKNTVLRRYLETNRCSVKFVEFRANDSFIYKRTITKIAEVFLELECDKIELECDKPLTNIGPLVRRRKAFLTILKFFFLLSLRLATHSTWLQAKIASNRHIRRLSQVAFEFYRQYLTCKISAILIASRIDQNCRQKS